MSEYRTTIDVDILGDGVDVECEIVCDVTPYRSAKINCSADGSSPEEGGVTIEQIIRYDTKENIVTDDLIDKIIDRVAKDYAEHISDRGI